MIQLFIKQNNHFIFVHMQEKNDFCFDFIICHFKSDHMTSNGILICIISAHSKIFLSVLHLFFNSKTSLNQATALSLKPAFLEKLHSNKGRFQFKRRHKIKKSIKLVFNQILVFCYDVSTWRSCIIINYRKVDNSTTLVKRSTSFSVEYLDMSNANSCDWWSTWYVFVYILTFCKKTRWLLWRNHTIFSILDDLTVIHGRRST